MPLFAFILMFVFTFRTILSKLYSLIIEIGKNSSIWQEFFRSVLKYSPKVGACGVAALSLLGSVSGFLLAGSKLSEASDILEMVTSHTLYLGTLLGPGTTTKTALIHLMMSLSSLSIIIV